MNDIIKKLQQDIVKEDYSFKKYIETHEVEECEKEGKEVFLDDIENRYFYNIEGNLSEEEIKRYMDLKIYSMCQQMNRNVDTMKSIMVFWVVLTLISMALAAFGWFNFINVISHP